MSRTGWLAAVVVVLTGFAGRSASGQELLGKVGSALKQGAAEQSVQEAAYDRAAAQYSVLIQAEPRNPALHAVRYDALFYSGRFQEAEKEAGALIALAPGVPHGHLMRAWATRQQGRWKDAGVDMGEFAAKGGEAEIMLEELVGGAIRENDMGKALEFSRKAVELADGGNSEEARGLAHGMLGYVLALDGQMTAAADEVNAALKLAPGQYHARRVRALLLLAGGRGADAEEAATWLYQDRRSRHKGNPNQVTEPRGICRLMLGKYAEAEQDWSNDVKACHWELVGYSLGAFCQAMQGRISEAQDMLTSGAAVEARWAAQYRLQGPAIEDRKIDLEIDKLVRERFGASYVCPAYTRGLMRAAVGRQEEAKADLRTAAEGVVEYAPYPAARQALQALETGGRVVFEPKGTLALRIVERQ